MERLGMIFLSPGDAEGETSEKLEFDDPLNEHAWFLRSQGLQNEVKIVPKRAEERKKSRERREKRKKYADECLGSARERSRARRRPPRVPRGGGRRPIDWIRPDLTYLLFRRFRLDFRARWLRNLGFGSNSRIQHFVVR